MPNHKPIFDDIDAVLKTLWPYQLSNEDALDLQLGIFKAAIDLIKTKRIGYSGRKIALRNFYAALGRGYWPQEGAYQRLGDKFSRLEQMQNDEDIPPIDDPLVDLGPDITNYGVIVYMLTLEYMRNQGSEKQAQLADEVMTRFIELGRKVREGKEFIE